MRDARSAASPSPQEVVAGLLGKPVEAIRHRWLPTPQILDACCGGRHWWWDKNHPLALYMDIREAPRGSVDHRPNWECSPDLHADFRAMPYEDASFQLVLFDPPHIVRPNPSGRIVATFGALTPDTEQEDLRRGFAECWRVLAPGGTLVFKWAGDIKRVKPHFPSTPIVGTRSPRGGQTRWFIFYKPLNKTKGDGEDLREALRWIALGRTGSYGTAEEFAKAVLADAA